MLGADKRKNSCKFFAYKSLSLVLEAGLEPAQPRWPRDFKSLVSTIPPFEQPLLPQCGTWPFCDSGAKVSSFAKISKENLQ